jgi:hypothetical protein
MSPKKTEHMTWYHSHGAMDVIMVHPSNSEAWKYCNRMHSQFSMESQNIYVGLFTDESIYLLHHILVGC